MGCNAAPCALVIAIEAWTEPNLKQFWGTPPGGELPREPQRFARLVNKAADSVEAVAPEVMVFPGAMSPRGVNANQYMRDATDPTRDPHIVAAKVDALSFHLYAFDVPNNPNTRQNETDPVRSDREAREQIRAYYDENTDGLRSGFTNKARWITEVGFPSSGLEGPIETATIRNQRRRLLHAYFRYANLPSGPRPAAFIVYRLVDDPEFEDGDFGVLDESAGFPLKESATDSAYCRLAQLVARPDRPVDPSRC